MARHVPMKFLDTMHLVQRAVATARGQERRFFSFAREVAPGVRLVLSEAAGQPVVFSLWTRPADIVELCGDGAYPATAGLLAIDKEQAYELLRKGVLVDLSQFVRSESNPGVYYVLFDYLSPEQVRRVLHRLVPAIESYSVAA